MPTEFTGSGLLVIKRLALTDYTGVDAGTGRSFVCAAEATALISQEGADYLLTNFPDDWELCESKVGALSDLDTTEKGSIVGAINEVLGLTTAAEESAAIGTLASLTTEDQTNLVSAVNEVDANADTAQGAADDANAAIGTIGDLDTTATDLVEAVNEVKVTADGAATAIGTIGDLDTTATDLVEAVNEVKTTADAALVAPAAVNNVVALKTDYTTLDLDTEAEIISALNATNTAINALITMAIAAGLMEAPA